MNETSASPSGPATPLRRRPGPFNALLCYFPARPAILPAEEQERFALPHHHVFDLRNKDGVVTRLLGRLQPALQIRQRPVQDRSPLRRAVKARPGFLFSM